MTATTIYTTTHEGTTWTRKTNRSYTHAVLVKKSAEKVIAECKASIELLNGYAEQGFWNVEIVAKRNAESQAKIADVMANGTKWGVIGFCGRRDLAEKLAAKWAWMGEIAIATAEVAS